MNEFKIGHKMIGDGHPPYFIADIAANHDGDLNRAYKLIELAKESGADAAKFQNFIASKIVSKKGFDSMKGKSSHQASWSKSVFEIYEDASVDYKWTRLLKEKCDEVGIEYFTSPYDFQSVDNVDEFVNVYKIGSGDITWTEIINYIAKKKKPVLIATGASTMEDVNRAMKTLKAHTDEIVLMQCNTNYTASPDNFKYINLNVLKTYRDKYPQIILGLSDHTHGHSTILGAVALGARVFEKHFTDDNNRVGPDHKFAMNPGAWREMVDRANELDLALGNGKKKIEANETDTSIVQRRALRYTKDLGEGDVIAKDDLIAVRPIPDNGIPPFESDSVIGKSIIRNVKCDDLVVWEDLS